MPPIDIHDLPAGRNEIPPGTTIDGHGATITLTGRSPAFLELSDDCTVRNLTIRGHVADAVEQNGKWDYPDGASAWREASVGISIKGDNCHLENVTCTGFTHAGISIGATDSEALNTVRISDCSLINNNCRALGYGIVVYTGTPIIEDCYFDNNRHDVAGSGARNCGYEVRYSDFGPRGRIYGCEMHKPGGDSVSIHHNTFADKRNAAGNRRSLIVNRGTPQSDCHVHSNWFQGALTTSLLGNSESMYQFENNHEGPAAPPPGIGRPDPPATSTRTGLSNPQTRTLYEDLRTVTGHLRDVSTVLTALQQRL